jgi:O-antigen ligase
MIMSVAGRLLSRVKSPSAAAGLLIVILAVLCAVAYEKNPLFLLLFSAFAAFALILTILRPTLPEAVFFALPLITPLGTGLLNGIITIKVTLVWLALFLSVWVLTGASGGWLRSCSKTPYMYFLMLYAVLFAASLFTHPIHENALLSLVQLLALIGVYWLTSQLLMHQDLTRILSAVILGTTVGCIGFFIAFSRGMPSLTLSGFAYGLMRPVVLNHNANSWALYPMVGLPLAAALIMHAPKSFWKSGLLIGCALILFLEAGLNMSRSVLLGVFVGILIAALLHPVWRKVLLAAFVLGSAAILLLFPQVLSLGSSIFRLQAGLSGRDKIWAMTFGLISDTPFLGMGPGWFRERFFLNAPFMENGIKMGSDRLNAHNAFLQIGVDVGLLAMLVALAILLFFGYRSIKLWRRVRNFADRAVLIAVTSLMFGEFVHILFEVDFMIPHLYLNQNIFMVLLLAIQDQLYSRAFSSL